MDRIPGGGSLLAKSTDNVNGLKRWARILDLTIQFHRFNVSST